MTTEILQLLGARMLGRMLLWGTLTGGLLLIVAIGACLLVARTRALRVGFRGAKYARGAIYAWTCLVFSCGSGGLGALHGAVVAFGEVAEDPSFTATTLRPAAEPLTEGLIHAVAIQGSTDATPMLAGVRQIPVATLRLVLTDTTGAALIAGLRRVPALQRNAAARSGSELVAAIGSIVANSKVEGAFDAVGLRPAMVDLAAHLPPSQITRAELSSLVERRFLPRFVQASLRLGEGQLRWHGIFWIVIALLAPVALLWMTEWIVRWSRSRRSPESMSTAS